MTAFDQPILMQCGGCRYPIADSRFMLQVKHGNSFIMLKTNDIRLTGLNVMCPECNRRVGTLHKSTDKLLNENIELLWSQLIVTAMGTGYQISKVPSVLELNFHLQRMKRKIEE